jgi:hypothetical protein
LAQAEIGRMFDGFSDSSFGFRDEMEMGRHSGII